MCGGKALVGLNLISFDDLQFKQGGRAAKTDTQFTCKKKKKGGEISGGCFGNGSNDHPPSNKQTMNGAEDFKNPFKSIVFCYIQQK